MSRWLVSRADEAWSLRPTLSGLTSGEGLIKQAKDHQGPLLAVESEFADLDQHVPRPLEPLHRVPAGVGRARLWVPTKSDPLYCDDAYISIIGHTTLSDLKEKLNTNEVENGLVNRFMWMNVYRDGELPEGGDFEALTQALGPLVNRLIDAVNHARTHKAFDHPCKKTPRAKEFWDHLYRTYLKTPKTGLYAKATVRAAPNILRLATIFMALDMKILIDVTHIEAGLAFWDYCDTTAAHIFGNPRDDGNMAKLIAFIEPLPKGATRTTINRRDSTAGSGPTSSTPFSSRRKAPACSSIGPSRPSARTAMYGCIGDIPEALGGGLLRNLNFVASQLGNPYRRNNYGKVVSRLARKLAL